MTHPHRRLVIYASEKRPSQGRQKLWRADAEYHAKMVTMLLQIRPVALVPAVHDEGGKRLLPKSCQVREQRGSPC